MYSRRSKGFTLVELMITIAVVAIMSAIAYPSFQATLRSNRMATTSNELIAALSLARSEAVKNKRGGGVCASVDGSSCDGAAWTDGWLVWADVNGSGGFDKDDVPLRFSAGRKSMLGVADQTLSISFDARGRTRATAAEDITLRPAECGSQLLQRRLTISPTGQVRLHKEACA